MQKKKRITKSVEQRRLLDKLRKREKRQNPAYREQERMQDAAARREVRALQSKRSIMNKVITSRQVARRSILFKGKKESATPLIMTKVKDEPASESELDESWDEYDEAEVETEVSVTPTSSPKTKPRQQQDMLKIWKGSGKLEPANKKRR